MTRLRPPGREFSRFSFLSVDGGFDDVREFCRAAEVAAQINQLLFAELLQITPIHADMDSEFLSLASGAETLALLHQSAKWPG